MHWLWFVLLAIGMVLLLTCIVPIQIQIRYTRRGKLDTLQVWVRVLFGLFTYTVRIPNLDAILKRNRKKKIKAAKSTGLGEHPTDKKPVITRVVQFVSQFLHASHELSDMLRSFLPQLRRMSKVFQVVGFRWHTQLGVSDAAITATASGALWTAKGAVLGLLSHFLSFQQIPDISIIPAFGREKLDTNLDCIIRFSLGKAILAAVKMGIYLLREGQRPWRIIRYRV